MAKKGRPFKIKEPNVSAALEDCIKCKDVSQQAYEDLLVFMAVLEGQRACASKDYHYKDLFYWDEAVYGFVRKMLTKYKFINGGAAMGLEQPADANFWWQVYGLVSNVCYSPNLHSKVASHHSSAFERNEALITDVQILMERVIK
ncbi:MAG: hypothetical protein EHM34_04260 [Nitrosopumilales archaeon]|nr:MAG: hypothetical protein EHM34_04260 [Nitrosopumilales archaeon]